MAKLPLSKEIMLGEQPIDIGSLTTQQRIILFPDKKVFILKGNLINAQVSNEEDFENKGVILTPKDACRIYPQYFNGRNVVSPEKPIHQFAVKMEDEMYRFCVGHGNVSKYIRGLVEREMRKEAK